MTKPTEGVDWNDLAEQASIWTVSLGAIGCILVLGAQAFSWLEKGWWPEISALVLVHYVAPDWARDPQHLLGAHKVFAWLNAGVASLLLGFLGGVLVAWIGSFLNDLFSTPSK